jgi:hypothetical protein
VLERGAVVTGPWERWHRRGIAAMQNNAASVIDVGSGTSV